MKEIKVSAAVIINKSKSILIAKRGHGEFKGMWEFPGGKIKQRESSKRAVIRELKEELNVDIEVVKFITTVYWKYDNFILNMKLYLCKIKRGDPKLIEHSAYKWVNKNNLNNIEFLPADKSIIKLLIKTCLKF